MKNKLVLFSSIVILLLAVSISRGDDKSKRFSKPHEIEAEENKIVPESFVENPSPYSSVLFTNYNISEDSAPQNETSVKISRKNPSRVVAAWRDFRRGVSPANRKVGYSYSTDGGQTWSVSRLLDSTLLPNGLIRNSDPTVGVDSAGNFYIAVIALTGTNGNGTLAVYKSTDGGVTFPIAVVASQTGSEDKEYIATDFTIGSPFRNYLYMSWTTFSGNIANLLTRSTNDGIIWTTGQQFNEPNNVGQGSDLAIGANGEVNITWLSGDASNDWIMFDKSTDGGNTFATDIRISEGATPVIPITSGGVTFPSIAADISGSNSNGYLYVTWCDSRNGDPDVFVSRSTNRGANWSSPLRVNDDAVANGKLQCWPWIEVNDSGNVAVIYYDSRNTASQNIIDAYLAVSTDHGISFNNYRLSSQSFPTSQPNSAVRFGDYIGIDYYKNTIVPVWCDERAGGVNMEAYTAIVSSPVNISTLASQLPDKFELYQNYPNPFNPTTRIIYNLSEDGFVTLKIYSALGQEMETIVNSSRHRGSYSETWDGSKFTSGVYFYSLTVEANGNAFTDTKKMILLK